MTSDHQSDIAHNRRVLAIVNQKGGVGKTTTAINLGTGLAEAGKSCLVVDLDPQGNASTGLGVFGSNRTRTTYDVLTEGLMLSSSAQPTSIENLSLAPGSIDLSGIDAELMDDTDRAFRLKKAFGAGTPDSVSDKFDYILIDCPPSLSILTVNAMAASSGLIVPMQCEFFALEGLSQLLGTVRRLQKSVNNALRIHGIVLTMFDRRNRLSFQVEEDVRKNLGDVVYQTVIPRNVRLSEAPSYAMPALIYDRDCAGSVAYRRLVREIIERDETSMAA